MPLVDSPRVVVTGAGSGLGRAFCLELARRRGARILCADIDEAAAHKTAATVGGIAARCDVGRAEEVQALADAAEREFGGVDLVINNAGVAVGGRVGEVALDDWRWVMDVNLWGVIHGCHVFAPRLRAQGRGHILNVASAAGLLAPPGMAPYNVTKAAVIALSETLSAELKDAGVGVTVLCPTFFRTNIANSSRAVDGKQRALVEKLMARSKVQADDVARLALDAAARNELYALPHADGRWMWRLKRWAPSSYVAVTARVASRMLRSD
ncbi:MAG TPA: SDR family NAD(P)-dependent oxidoreductase [Polyangia bacterium]|jgi:NAD(P)-dependent dehydrogenase (short-subunit alcohol dehydrogenase family)